MRVLSLFLLLASCAHEAPTSTDDPFIAPPRVSGTLVVPGVDRPANTYVLIYDAQTPPPPAGLGRPFTFALVPSTAFETTGSGEQVYEAPFDMSLAAMPDGVTDVLVTALVDMDGDFYPLDPFSAVSAGATCGDLVGAHVGGLSSPEPAPVAVAPNEHASGITVLVARTSTLERPVFEFLGGTPVISVDDYTGEGLPPTFTLRSTWLETVLLDEDGAPTDTPFVTFDAGGPCAPNFAVTGHDNDGDGVIDPHPVLGASFRDVAPRILAQYLGTIDADTGVIVPPPEGEPAWSAEYAISPTQTWFGEIPIAPGIDPRTELEVAWVPGALATDPATGEVIDFISATDDLERFKATVPRGAWSVTLINVAGQTWTVPNLLYLADPEGLTGTTRTQRAVLLLE